VKAGFFIGRLGQEVLAETLGKLLVLIDDEKAGVEP
jgi:hypothetical protein